MAKLWDIFCTVVDNYGDVGVCWRLSADLAARGEQVRLWLDDASALAWMAEPAARDTVTVELWRPGHDRPDWPEPGDTVIEAFGCELPPGFQQRLADAAALGRVPRWINLEYLSAEPWVERCHGLPSPVMSGPARGLVKQFVYPGFTARTGGLLREPGLSMRQDRFDRAVWRADQAALHGIDPARPWASVFSYESPAMPDWLRGLADSATPLLVTPGRTAAAVLACQPAGPVAVQGWRPQAGFDEMLWACDFNLVRGEDSLVRALWAGRAFAWHIYPQDDLAHHDKLEAFLDWLDAPADLRAWHRVWNGVTPGHALPPIAWESWREVARAARTRLLGQDDLVSQLLAPSASQGTI